MLIFSNCWRGQSLAACETLGNLINVGCREKREENFLTPYISYIMGNGDTKIFLADGALLGLHTSKISDPKSLRGVGENV